MDHSFISIRRSSSPRSNRRATRALFASLKAQVQLAITERGGITGVAALVFLLGAACTENSIAPDPECDEATIIASVSSGSQPTISWSPDCGMAIVLVEELGGNDMWSVFVPDPVIAIPANANRITPPVTYGVRPNIAGLAMSNVVPLVPGTRYNLFLWRLLPPSSPAMCITKLEDLCMFVKLEFTAVQ